MTSIFYKTLSEHLLNDTLEKISGYKAENIQITEFLQNIFPNFSIGTLSQTNTSSQINTVTIPQLKSSENENIINLNLNDLADLYHTKILEAKFDNQISSKNWRSVLDIGLRIAFEKGFSADNLQSELNINIKEGQLTHQGFGPIEGINYSWQSQDANKTAKNLITLAKMLNCEISIEFEWREKGKFPTRRGLIHWKP